MSYHRFVRPGEATVEVLMLGNVGASGVYVVGVDTGLPEFLALSGMTFGASSRGERSQITVRIYRQQGAQRELIFESPVEEVLTAPANIPAFRSGDIVYLESVSRTRFDWFQVIRTVSSIASLIYVAQRLIRGTR